LHGYIEPLVKVLIATIPSKDIWEVIAAALTDLVPDPNKGFRLSTVEGRCVILLWLGVGDRCYLRISDNLRLGVV